jgi:hypothetical protein
MVLNVEPGSNVNDERSVRPLKHASPSTSTDAGIQSDCSPSQFRNVLSGIVFRFEPDSKIIEHKRSN